VVICGVDPGPAVTAVVITHGPDVLAQRTWIKPDLDPTGLRRLVDEIDDLIATTAYTAPTGTTRIYVEDLNPPTPHLGMTQPRWLMQTALIIGALCAGLRPTPRLVPPAQFGTGLLAAYPRCLVGPRERTGRGKGPFQHLRSAYDTALAGAAARRLEVVR
jgi:hypothetical protein